MVGAPFAREIVETFSALAGYVQAATQLTKEKTVRMERLHFAIDDKLFAEATSAGRT